MPFFNSILDLQRRRPPPPSYKIPQGQLYNVMGSTYPSPSPIGYLRVESGGRGRFHTFVNSHPDSDDNLIEDLNIGAPTRTLDGRRDRMNRRVFDLYRSDETQRSSDQRDLRPLPIQSALNDAYQPGLRTGQEQNSLAFGEAVSKLHRQVIKAEEFYSRFQEEYNNDISSIKRYATEEMLTRLWNLKINGKRDKRNISLSGDNEDLESSKEQFKETREKLVKALEEALTSNIRPGNLSRKSEARINSGQRLKMKINTANALVLCLLDSVTDGTENCQALLHELQQLKELVDPDLGLNKNLSRSDGVGESVGSEYGGEEGQDQGRDSWDR